MAKELVTVAKYDVSMYASLAKQCLDDAGIPAIIVGESAASIFPGAAPIEVQVEADMAREAIEILEAFNEAQTLADKDIDEDIEQES
jgi:hypothetical protein